MTIEPLQLISKWVFGGDLPEYIQKHPDADRIKLVSVLSVVFIQCIILLPAVRRC